MPENWNDRSSPPVKVFYYVGNKDIQRTPIVFFNGGPGFSSHGLMSTWKSYLPSIQVPFVVIDQRGTGCSSSYPLAIDAQSFSRLQFYGSRGIVHDAEAVRKHLFGNRPWKIFGQSYGGFIVHRYFTMFPLSIVSAHAHGLALTRHPFGDYYFRVLAQQRIIEQYFNQYPQDRARVMKVHHLLREKDCFTRGSFSVCGRGAWDGILTNLLAANQSSELTKILNELLQGQKLNRALFKSLVEQHIFSIYAPIEPMNLLSTKASTQVLMTGQGYINLMEITTDPIYPDDFSNNCKAINEYFSKITSLESMAINECRFVLAQKYKLNPQAKTRSSLSFKQPSLSVVQDRLSLDTFVAAIKANRHIPFYLYSGALDTVVPTEIFAEEVSELNGLIHYYDFPNSAHEGFLTEPKVWFNLLSTE